MTQGLGSATSFSLSAEPPVALAPDPRVDAEYDPAWLVDGESRRACRLHRLSAAGATLHLDGEATPGERHDLTLANGQSLSGAIQWAEPGAAGFLFDAPLDVVGTLARNLANLPAERRSVPRVEIGQTVCVRRGDLVDFALARNVSQGGTGIETRLALAPGDTVQCNFDGLRPLDGEVMWAHGPHAGIAFGEALGWQTLMPWLRELQQQRIAARAHPTAPHAQEELIPEKLALRLDTPGRVRLGVRWWNVTVRALTAQLVEFEARAPFKPGSQLWVSLPGIAGAPANVVETRHQRTLCAFRLPLGAREMRMLGAPVPR